MRCRHSSAATLIAFLAWLASALLPLVHAAMPMPAAGGAEAWCGPPSVQLSAAYSALPDEIRQALADDDGPSIEDCERACGLALQALLPDTRVAPAAPPRSAARRVAAWPAAAPSSGVRARPPARGPPQA